MTATTTRLARHVHATPFGALTVLASDSGVRAILWPDHPAHLVRVVDHVEDAPDHPHVRRTCEQLDAYAAGELHDFRLPLDPRGTELQRQVWDALAAIPYGHITSYGALARQLGRPSAVRAVANAVGRNPLSIVVPCHRVVGADGSLTGFAGGLDVKRRLLDLEARR